MSTLSVSTSSLTSCPRASPYFGQAVWFKVYHQEKVPSAVERYQKETVRVISVLDGVLQKQEWLVGGKPTIADLSFIPWSRAGLMVTKDISDVEKEYPHFWAWVFPWCSDVLFADGCGWMPAR